MDVSIPNCPTSYDVTSIRTVTEGESPMKTWFITGASRGFGREWAEAALDRGDRVAATARDRSSLVDLAARYGDRVLVQQLDVTDRGAAFHAVRAAHERFGRLDVVVNNAGYGHFGMVEELTEEDIRAQMETNFFGALWVTQAALPFLRAQGSGHIVQVTSEGGVRAFPGIGAYHASKWALEGLGQSLAQEVAGFGIHVTMLEPGPYQTGWLKVGSRASEHDPAYREVRKAIDRGWDPGSLGIPAATRPAILEVVDAERPPLRQFFGRGSLAAVEAQYGAQLAEWRAGQQLAVRASGLGDMSL